MHSLAVTLYSPIGEQIARVGAIQSMDLTTTIDGTDAGTFVVPAGHPDAVAFGTPSTRVKVEVDGREVSTGTIVESVEESTDGLVTATYAGDRQIFDHILCSPIPEATDIHASQAVREFKAYTGPAETVALDLIREQVQRAGYTLAVPTSTGAGPFAAAHVRWDVLSEVIPEYLRASGFSWRVRATGGVGAGGPGTLPLELVRLAPRQAAPIKLNSPAVTKYLVTATAPTVTRVITAGDGTGATRELWGPHTYTNLQLTEPNPESAWPPRERFVEARNATGGNGFLVHQQSAKDELIKSRGGVRVEVTLTETDNLRWWNDWRLGDSILVQLTDGAQITDRITTVEFKASADDGFLINPKIGDTRADPVYAPSFTLTNIIRDVGKVQRR